MVQKPLTVARMDYITSVIEVTNQSGLPGFVIVEALEKVLDEARKAADQELERDTQAYKEAIATENEAENQDAVEGV